MKKYIEENKQRLLDELFDLLRLKSVSADAAYDVETAKTAAFVEKSLIAAGVDFAEICETAGHPIVYAEKIIDVNLPTVLVYGHYDVQPADPIELWDSPPFEPVIKKTDVHPEGAVFARGACDDKGQMYMHVKAFEYMIKTDSLPCNVKFMIEGEEEVGSTNLAIFVKENKEKLKADVILVSDTSIIDNETPSITVGLRGLSYVEVEVEGPNRDLHSGVYGGTVGNPCNILADMISQLKDDKNRITIPGFYDDVELVNDADRADMRKAPFNLTDFKADLNVSELELEEGYGATEGNTIRPALDVNGIWGGYTGEGAKTVLPSKAYAKISMRLVPYQSSEKITQLFKAYFESIAPKSVKVKVTPHHGGEPIVIPTNFKGYQAAKKAMGETFGKEAIPIRSGGSIPIVALFEKELGLKSILMGFGLHSDLIHSPNEHYGLFNYFKGIETIPLFYKYFTEK